MTTLHNAHRRIHLGNTLERRSCCIYVLLHYATSGHTLLGRLVFMVI